MIRLERDLLSKLRHFALELPRIRPYVELHEELMKLAGQKPSYIYRRLHMLLNGVVMPSM